MKASPKTEVKPKAKSKASGPNRPVGKTNLGSIDKPLTSQQTAFVKAMAEGDTISNSATRAGYAHHVQGYELIKVPAVAHAIKLAQAKYEAAADVTRKKVMDMHAEAFEMAKLMSEPATMVSAAREIGKMCGYYAPVETRVKVDVSGNIVLDKMNSLSDAELLAIISKGASYASPQLLVDDAGDSGE